MSKNPKIFTGLMKMIINHYGEENQHDKVVEELNELIVAVKNRKTNRANLIEEIADVTIMLYQLEIMHGVEKEEIWEVMFEKTMRTIERMNEEWPPIKYN